MTREERIRIEDITNKVKLALESLGQKTFFYLKMDLLNIIEDGLFLLMIGCSSLEEEKILNKSQCMLEKI